MSQEVSQSERRAIVPLAYDAERLVATLMSPTANLLRRLAAAERLYTLMPTYIERTLFEAAIKLAGKEALTGEGAEDKDARRGLFRNALEDMLEAMEETRQRIVEVKLPPLTISENVFNEDVPKMIKSVAKALTDWFYAATEEARKEGKPYSYDTEKPGYVLLITFASLVIVNGLRQLALIGD
jgi:phage terminase large subunit-like protein